MKLKDPIVLIDAKNFLYRHHATHSSLSTKDGFPTGVLYGCGVAMLSLAKKFPGAPLVFVWDGEGDTWRHKVLHPYQARRREERSRKEMDKAEATNALPEFMQMAMQFLEDVGPKQVHVNSDKPPYESRTKTDTRYTRPGKPVGYKAHRTHNMDAFADAQKQLPLFRKYLDKIGVRQFQFPCLEGDDLMGILATTIVDRNLFRTVVIHSSDKDFYQFIGDRITIWRNDKGGYFPVKEDIRADFGVEPDDWNKLRAIIGDAGDNIPHLFRGVGPKTAAKWVNAGLDASYESWKDLPGPVRSFFLEDKLRKYNVRERWEELHANWLCSRIVTVTSDKVLGPALHKQLVVLDKLSRADLLSDQDARTDENWRWLTSYLIEYEMSELYGRRLEIWRLP